MMRISMRGSKDYLGVLKQKKKKKPAAKTKVIRELLDYVDVDDEKWRKFTMRMPKSLFRLLELESENNGMGLAEMARILLKEGIMVRHD